MAPRPDLAEPICASQKVIPFHGMGCGEQSAGPNGHLDLRRDKSVFRPGVICGLLGPFGHYLNDPIVSMYRRLHTCSTYL